MIALRPSQKTGADLSAVGLSLGCPKLVRRRILPVHVVHRLPATVWNLSRSPHRFLRVQPMQAIEIKNEIPTVIGGADHSAISTEFYFFESFHTGSTMSSHR
jgi:hypothetical protein